MSNIKNSKQKLTKTIVETISDPSLRGYLIKVTKPNDKPFFIPVTDVRDGDEQRKAIAKLIKSNNKMNGSKYMRPSQAAFGDSYQDSYKNIK